MADWGWDSYLGKVGDKPPDILAWEKNLNLPRFDPRDGEVDLDVSPVPLMGTTSPDRTPPRSILNDSYKEYRDEPRNRSSLRTTFIEPQDTEFYIFEADLTVAGVDPMLYKKSSASFQQRFSEALKDDLINAMGTDDVSFDDVKVGGVSPIHASQQVMIRIALCSNSLESHFIYRQAVTTPFSLTNAAEEYQDKFDTDTKLRMLRDSHTRPHGVLDFILKDATIEKLRKMKQAASGDLHYERQNITSPIYKKEAQGTTFIYDRKNEGYDYNSKYRKKGDERDNGRRRRRDSSSSSSSSEDWGRYEKKDKEKEREKEREREKAGEREKEKEREKEREREREKEKDRERAKEKERVKETERERDRDRGYSDGRDTGGYSSDTDDSSEWERERRRKDRDRDRHRGHDRDRDRRSKATTSYGDTSYTYDSSYTSMTRTRTSRASSSETSYGSPTYSYTDTTLRSPRGRFDSTLESQQSSASDTHGKGPLLRHMRRKSEPAETPPAPKRGAYVKERAPTPSRSPSMPYVKEATPSPQKQRTSKASSPSDMYTKSMPPGPAAPRQSRTKEPSPSKARSPSDVYTKSLPPQSQSQPQSLPQPHEELSVEVVDKHSNQHTPQEHSASTKSTANMPSKTSHSSSSETMRPQSRVTQSAQPQVRDPTSQQRDDATQTNDAYPPQLPYVVFPGSQGSQPSYTPTKTPRQHGKVSMTSSAWGDISVASTQSTATERGHHPEAVQNYSNYSSNGVSYSSPKPELRPGGPGGPGGRSRGRSEMSSPASHTYVQPLLHTPGNNSPSILRTASPAGRTIPPSQRTGSPGKVYMGGLRLRGTSPAVRRHDVQEQHSSPSAPGVYTTPKDPYQVVGLQGAIVRLQQDLSSPKVATLPQGSEVVVTSRSGRRLYITSPVAGWLSLEDPSGAPIVIPIQ